MDPPIRNNFLKNTLPLNNAFAFGSVSVDKEIVESRKNVCKVNGEISFRVSDLYAAKNQKPLFGQMYCIDPDVAFKYRSEMLESDFEIKDEVLKLLGAIMKDHPFAESYRTADELYKEEIIGQARKCKGVPNFRVWFFKSNVVYVVVKVKSSYLSLFCFQIVSFKKRR